MSIHEVTQKFFDWLGKFLKTILDYPIDWVTVFLWTFSLAIIWVVISLLMSFVRETKNTLNKRKALSKIDPAEMVTIDGNTKLSLRGAVARVSAMSHRERRSVKILREDKTVLDCEQIGYIATLPTFKD